MHTRRRVQEVEQIAQQDEPPWPRIRVRPLDEPRKERDERVVRRGAGGGAEVQIGEDDGPHVSTRSTLLRLASRVREASRPGAVSGGRFESQKAPPRTVARTSHSKRCSAPSTSTSSGSS